MPLISSFTQPYNGFREVFFYAITIFIAKSKHTLCICKSLIGGVAIPYNGFREVFFYAIAVVITKPK